MLEQLGNFEIVAEAETGPEAIEQARITKPDIAIIDITLPGMNGVDVTLSITRALPRTRVLIFSMCDRDNMVFDAFRAGASGYVLKSDDETNFLPRSPHCPSDIGTFRHRSTKGLLERLAAPDRDRGGLTSPGTSACRSRGAGRVQQEIAHLMQISIKTVETHRAAAMRKLGLKTTAELVRYALRNDIAVA